MLRDERLQLAQYGVVPTERELGLAEQLECVQPPFLEPFPLGLGERLGGEVGERRAVPEPERLPEQARGRVGVTGSQLPPGAADQRFEALQVELAWLDDEPVAGSARLDSAGAERLAEPGDVDLERLDRRGRRLLAPERVDQGLARHRFARAQQQSRQDRALLRASDVDRAAVRADLDRPKDPEFHAFSLP